MHINYHHIADAIDHYKYSYPEIEVPWLVNDETVNATTPKGVRNFQTFAGNIVASGEQSFIGLMKAGKMPSGNWSCTTPCFRDEPPGPYNQMWFMKTELVSYKPNFDGGTAADHFKMCQDEMQKMMQIALAFFNKYVPARIVQTKIGFDIEAGGIELGSYGIRQHDKFEWVYGTGCAEPRLSQVIKRLGSRQLL